VPLVSEETLKERLLSSIIELVREKNEALASLLVPVGIGSIFSSKSLIPADVDKTRIQNDISQVVEKSFVFEELP
jgi:hypothetical protein